MTRVLSFNSLKGGVGKTTCAVLFGRVLVEAGHSVLMIDLDPQYSLSSFYCRGEPPLEQSVARYLKHRRVGLSDVVMRHDGLDLLPSSVELIDYGIERKLKRNSYALARKLERDEVRSRYDYIIVDTPPTFSFLNSLAVPLVDLVYVVTVPEAWAVRAISLYLSTLREFTDKLDTRYQDIHVIVNRFDSGQVLDRRTLEAFERRFAEYYVAPPIPFSNALRNFVLNQGQYKNYFQRVYEPVQEIVAKTLSEPSNV